MVEVKVTINTDVIYENFQDVRQRQTVVETYLLEVKVKGTKTVSGIGRNCLPVRGHLNEGFIFVVTILEEVD